MKPQPSPAAKVFGITMATIICLALVAITGTLVVKLIVWVISW